MSADPQTLIEAIKLQEAALVLPAFNKAIAWEIGTLARDLAVKRSHVVAIEIRSNGAPLFVTALDGTSPNSMKWLTRKSNTVALFDRSTYGLSMHLAAKNQTIARHALPEADYSADGGGFPLRILNGGIVGSLAVSGLDQRSDHELAVEALCLHLGFNYTSIALPQ
jgi:uncharacterized protein (UPF0303 family)